MHACPIGYAIGGVHVDRNDFLCRRVMRYGEENFVQTHVSTRENKVEREGMHACPPGMYMRGLHVDNNWLLCSKDIRSGSSVSSQDEFVDTGSQAYDMHVCRRESEYVVLTGIHVDDNRFLCAKLIE